MFGWKGKSFPLLVKLLSPPQPIMKCKILKNVSRLAQMKFGLYPRTSQSLPRSKRRFGSNASVHYFTPDNLPSEIEARSDLETSSGDTVRGYSVTVKQAYTTEADLEMRRDQLARVLKSIS